MTLHFYTRLAKLLAIAATLTALVAPAALARPDGWYAYAVSVGPSGSSTEAGTTFITDTLAPGGVDSAQAGGSFITDTLAPGSGTKSDVCTHGMPVTLVQAQACSTPEQPTLVSAQPVGDGGFDWGILGITVGGALALLLGAGGLRLRSQHRPATV
jgi:hypothetical protein